MTKAIVTVLLLLASVSSRGQATTTTSTTTNSSAPTTMSDGPSAQGTSNGNGAVASGSQSGANAMTPIVIRSAENDEQGKPATQTVLVPSTGLPGQAVAAVFANDFSRFAQTALGHSLPVFGSNLFSGSTQGFTSSSTLPVPDDYLIGTGDQIQIRAWGKIDIETEVTVDRNGQIFLPRVGTLTVAGLRMDQLTDFIHAAIAQQFTGFNLTVTLGKLRSIQIFVLGRAARPGVYTISSLSTLVNALFDSGGPSAAGTLRDIQLKRGGKVVTHLDVYSLLLSGDKSADVHLLPGDIIYIPDLGHQVALDGNVATPAIYELKADETIGSLLQEAGGLTVVAGTGRVVLERILEHSARAVEEFALDANGMTRTLHDGDILRVFPISPKIQNAVTLRGNVASPGLYAWHAGMRVSTLIPSRQFLLTSAYYSSQNALSQGVQGTPSIGGHDTEINWNYAVIERLNPADLTTKLIPFVLGEAVDHPTSANDKELQAGDVIVVYSRADIALPQELQAKYVQIDGQVNAPGTYRVEQGETLRDLVQRAGGLAPQAYLFASELTRESVRAEQARQLQRLVDEESQEALAPSNTFAGTLSGNSASAGSGQLELRRAYIARLNSIQPTGRVVLRLRPDMALLSDVPDFTLEDGDHFFVPSVPNTIEVLGNVYNQGAMRYSTKLKFGQYLNEAGGPTRVADKKREFVIHADGTIVSRQQHGSLENSAVYPGDTLVVPPKLKGANSFDLLGFATLLGSLAISAAAIRGLQ